MSDSKPVPSALEHLAVRLQDISDAWWKEHALTAPRPTVTFEIPPSAPAPRVGSLVDEIIAEAAAAEREACAKIAEAARQGG
ncbi:MAG: hypothetical protein VW547_15885, partial [Alphaproteobacteria bacterium]